MSSLEKRIINLAQIKEAIRQAIISKGVFVPERTSFSEFPAKILEIETVKAKKKKQQYQGDKANDR